jgi:hypothetical protein
MHERDQKCLRNFVGIPEMKIRLRRPKHRWEDIIIDLKDIGRAWIGFTWLRIGTIIMNFRVP